MNTVIESALEAMQQRAAQLEREAEALRADVGQVSVLLNWQLRHDISPSDLRRVAVQDAEVADYARMLDRWASDPVLQLVLQAHKAATWLKQSLPSTERSRAVTAVIAAMQHAAQEAKLDVPTELEAVIGD